MRWHRLIRIYTSHFLCFKNVSCTHQNSPIPSQTSASIFHLEIGELTDIWHNNNWTTNSWGRLSIKSNHITWYSHWNHWLMYALSCHSTRKLSSKIWNQEKYNNHLSFTCWICWFVCFWKSLDRTDRLVRSVNAIELIWVGSVHYFYIYIHFIIQIKLKHFSSK